MFAGFCGVIFEVEAQIPDLNIQGFDYSLSQSTTSPVTLLKNLAT